MHTSNLRALATALVIGTAVFGVAGVLTATSAQAAVRKAVGTPLTEAIAAGKAKNCDAANAKLRVAEGQGNKSPDEEATIARTKTYLDSVCGAGGVQGKFTNAYNSGHYQEVINMEDDLRKANLLTALNQTVIAQAYMKMGNNAGCIKYIRQNLAGAGEGVLTVLRTCANASGDKPMEQWATEQLVSRFGKPEYWRALLAQAQRTHGLRDPQTLDIFRLKLLTGSMYTDDDYMTLAQMASAQNLPHESLAVIKKGTDAKVLSGERVTRLTAFVTAQAAKLDATLPATEKAAEAARNGDALVKLGVYQTSTGDGAEAAKSIQAGIAKGVSDVNFAQVRLGEAYLAAKQNGEAAKAFAAVKGDANWVMIARLWSFYARR